MRPQSSLKELLHRYNWNSPIYISPHDSKTVYTGGNYLLLTKDRGQAWTVISRDIPELNNVLEEHKIKLIRSPEEIKTWNLSSV